MTNTPAPAPLDLIISAGLAARHSGADAEAVYNVTKAVAVTLNFTLPSEDFCLHGDYLGPGAVECPTCEFLFS